MLSKKGLVSIIVVWFLLTLVNYYYMNFFFLAFIWLGMILTFAVLTVIQIIKSIKERKEITRFRISKLLVFLMLLFLTIYRHKTNEVIEKGDWLIFENKRNEIVKQVINNELNPNVSWNGWICELPFEFPVVSNGGNDIGISRNKGITVTFWVFRNYFDSPSIHFVYSDDPDEIKKLNQQVADYPNDNWKIKENWYRVYVN